MKNTICYAVTVVYLVYYIIVLYNKMFIVQIAFSDADKQTITDYVNKYRALHGSPPLIWDPQAATFANTWSSYLLKNS